MSSGVERGEECMQFEGSRCEGEGAELRDGR